MARIFEIASQIKTPLGLAGVVFVAAFFILRSLVQRKALPAFARAISEKNITLIIWLLFVLGVLLIVFSFLGYVIGAPVSNDSLDYTGRVTDAVTHRTIRNASVSVEEDQKVPQVQTTDDQGIFHVKLRSSTNSVRIRVEANGYEIFDRSVTLTRTGIEDVKLSPVSPSSSPPQSNNSPPNPIDSEGNAHIRVWVNLDSGKYHCPGTQYYGNTKHGEFITQGEAQQKGYQAANGNVCR